MKIWDICIRRPVFTVMLVSAPIVMGLASYSKLGVDLFPNVDIPVVAVITTLQGADVEQMEAEVTRPLEEAVNTVSGIDELRSTTKEGFSQIVLGFVLEKSGDVAAQEVRDKVSGVLATLPPGTDPPVVEKFSVDASPVLTLVVSGKRDAREITEIARKRIKDDLQSVKGVGTAVVVGGRRRAVNVYLDPDKLQARRLSVEDVRNALVSQNVEVPGGRVDQTGRELVMRVKGRVERPADFETLVVTTRDGFPVRVRDVGRVVDGVEEPRGLSRLDGDPAVSIVIQKQSGENTVAVVDRVTARLERLKAGLPADIRVEVIRDQSRFIRDSIEEVKFHLLLAAGLVTATIFLFIRDWRTTVVAGLAIPTSIVGTFAFMDVMGYTLNNMTLLGLILAVGIVIDDAVVVLENVFRHMEEYGRTPLEAASVATQEIALAVIATTLSLVVIFAPIAFMSGTVGRFFNSFGYVVAFSILLSLAVSFTLTPMLCAHFLRPLKHAHAGGAASQRDFWGWLTRRYMGALSWSLGGRGGWRRPLGLPLVWLPNGWHRHVVVAAAFAVFLSTPVLMAVVGSDFVPKDDQSEFEVDITLPEGTNLERAEAYVADIEGRLKQLRGVTSVFSVVGDTSGRVARGQGDVTHANLYCRMIDLRERPYGQLDAMKDARAMLAGHPDLRATVQFVSAIRATGFRQVQIDLNLRGPDLEKLQEYSATVANWMRRQGGRYVDVDTSLSLRKPELPVHIDRDRAADLGVSVQAAASSLALMVGGAPVTKYRERDELYDVWVRAEGEYRDRIAAVERMYVPSDRGGLVQVGTFAAVTEGRGPTAIDRYAGQRQVIVSANLDGLVLGEAVADITAYMKAMNMPPEYTHEFLGEAKLMAESNTNFAIAFLLAFVFMYMILAAQFESLVHPITILLAIPLTLPFALMSLILLQTPLDIYGMIGLFMLFGIVKKNGILQVDYTNVLRARGVPRDEAILRANETRLRPILMTTVMLVAAMIPIATGSGPGAGARASMAKVILGGQVLSLFLSLLITPVAYSLWDDLSNRAKGAVRWVRRRGGPKPSEPAGEASGETVLDPPAPALSVNGVNGRHTPATTGAAP